MDPRVKKLEHKLHLSYKLPHRIHTAEIYPTRAPNGSDVIIYGHDSGLRIIWRGGRRRKERQSRIDTAPTQPNGREHDVIVIDDDDDDPPPQTQPRPEDEFEEDGEELDPDCPCPSIIQQLDVELDTEVLHLAIPTMPTSPPPRTTEMLKAHAMVAVACADGTQRVLTFALAPPANDGREPFVAGMQDRQLIFPSHGSTCRALAAKIVLNDAMAAALPGADLHASSFLLVSAASETLSLYRFSIFNDITSLRQDAVRHTVPIPHLAKHISFHPSGRSTELLVVDVQGAVRIYNPYPSNTSSRPTSADPPPRTSESLEQGRWITAFYSPFTNANASTPRRKRILDAKFLMSGKAIIVLLEDGEWGIWDVSGTAQAADKIHDFSLRGSLGALESAEPSVQKRSSSRLAPMTPNTRKVRSEALFSGPQRVPGAAVRGGISISPGASRSGQTDESVVMWYGSDVYSIPSVNTFWQRRSSHGGGQGTLYAPGLKHISDINVMNEIITAVAQIPSSATSPTGQMSLQRDLLISAEHRFVILQGLRPVTTNRQLFQQAATERPRSVDQAMLDVGQLALDGMDRMLDSMANGNGTHRRVGFAH